MTAAVSAGMLTDSTPPIMRDPRSPASAAAVAGLDDARVSYACLRVT